MSRYAVVILCVFFVTATLGQDDCPSSPSVAVGEKGDQLFQLHARADIAEAADLREHDEPDIFVPPVPAPTPAPDSSSLREEDDAPVLTASTEAAKLLQQQGPDDEPLLLPIFVDSKSGQRVTEEEGHEVVAEDKNCNDQSNTGFNVLLCNKCQGIAASCSDMKGLCRHSTWGNKISGVCPKTCGRCSSPTPRPTPPPTPRPTPPPPAGGGCTANSKYGKVKFWRDWCPKSCSNKASCHRYCNLVCASCPCNAAPSPTPAPPSSTSGGSSGSNGKCLISDPNWKCKGRQCVPKDKYQRYSAAGGKWCLTNASSYCKKNDSGWCNSECKCPGSCPHACGRCPARR